MAENLDLTQKNDNALARSDERSGKSDTELGSSQQTGPLTTRQQETPGSVEGREEKAHDLETDSRPQPERVPRH